jgi:hypothetical protein
MKCPSLDAILVFIAWGAFVGMIVTGIVGSLPAPRAHAQGDNRQTFAGGFSQETR